MKAKRIATVDDLARERAARAPIVMDCDTPGCGARGVFDHLSQAGGWLVTGNNAERVVVITCPRCNDRRRNPQQKGTRA